MMLTPGVGECACVCVCVCVCARVHACTRAYSLQLAVMHSFSEGGAQCRGDVGSWVREAAMASLPPLLTLMADRCSDMATSTSSAASPHSPTTSKAISTDTSLLSQHSHDENSLAEANGCSLNPVADGNSYPPKSITPSTADTLDKSKVSSANKAAGPEANGDSDISPPASATAAEEAASDKAPSQPCSKSAEQLMAAAIQGIVRQSVERIVRTREVHFSLLWLLPLDSTGLCIHVCMHTRV